MDKGIGANARFRQEAEEVDGLYDLAREAEDKLYNHLDAYGATKRTAYAISDLVRAIVAAELAREKLK